MRLTPRPAPLYAPPMSMSNAERQRLFKARRRERLASAVPGSGDDATATVAPPPSIPDPSPVPVVTPVESSPATVADVAPSTMVTLADLAAELGMDTAPAVAPIIDTLSAAGNGRGEAVAGAAVEQGNAHIIIDSMDQGECVGQAQSKVSDDDARTRGKGRKGKAGKPATVTTEAAQVTTVTREGGGDAIAVVGSPSCTRDGNGHFVARPQVVPPCTVDQFEEVCNRYVRGDLTRDIIAAVGVECWAAVEVRGWMEEHQEHWREVKRLRQVLNASDVEDAGRLMLAVARGDTPMTEEEADTPKGHVSRRVVTRSPAALDCAAGKLMPAVHGRQAGRGAAVTVNANNAAIFGGAPPAAALDGWAPAP